MDIQEHARLADLSTFKIGGEARFLVRVATVEELAEALAFARERRLRVLVLGGGSNMLVSDAGFDGVVVKIQTRGIVREGSTLVAAAGEEWDGLVARAVEEGLWGLENLSGIPGSVGAAPVQNVGAYGAEVKDALLWLEAYDTETGTIRRFSNAECAFGYRTSVFKREAGRYVILRAAFALNPQGVPRTAYKDLQGADSLTLEEVRARVLSIRAGKFPDLSKEGTAGSFFLNPVVTEEKAAEILAHYPELPHFKAAGGVKLSLAWLLDRGLGAKGLSEGGARLYERQPLVITASRDASASEVERLAAHVAQLVKNNFGIDLEAEVRIIH